MHYTCLFAVWLSVISSSSVVADNLKPFLSSDNLLFDRFPFDLSSRQSCSSNGYDSCGSGCMPRGFNCCGSSGSYCPSSDRCDGGGCCPIGKTCSGPGGTVNVDLTYTSSYTRSSSSYYSSPTYRSSSSYYGGGGGGGGGSSSSSSYSYSTPTYGSPTRTTSNLASNPTPSCNIQYQTLCGGICISDSYTCCSSGDRYCPGLSGCVDNSGPSYQQCIALPGARAIGGACPAALGRDSFWAVGAAIVGAVAVL